MRLSCDNELSLSFAVFVSLPVVNHSELVQHAEAAFGEGMSTTDSLSEYVGGVTGTQSPTLFPQ